MRYQGPLILGAGPAGCAAAIALARGGAAPLLLDRDAVAGDALCGGFLSWNTAAQLGALGVDAETLGAHRVTRLRLFASGNEASARLPAPAWGLSRYALDNALRRAALAAGAVSEIDQVRSVEGLTAHGRREAWSGESLFLATGKHDVRGLARPRLATDPALGLRLRLDPSPALAAELAGTIELHLFAGGYAGIVVQESGAANLCLAMRKSALAAAGGSPRALLANLARAHPAFAARLEPGWERAPIDGLGAVPYGHIVREGVPGLFRLGDQAAVIPSLAGEGMGIALASGTAAAATFLASGPAAAPHWQATFARSARGPVRLAGWARSLAEAGAARAALPAALAAVPWLAGLVMDRTRIAA